MVSWNNGARRDEGRAAMPTDTNKDRRYVRHAGDQSRFTFKDAFSCAQAGLRYALGTQRNFKIHAAVAILAIVLGFLFRISGAEWCAIVLCIMVVFALELANTAVESAIDLVSPQWNELAKRAKDCAAASVYVAAIGSVVVAAIVFIPKLLVLAGVG